MNCQIEGCDRSATRTVKTLCEVHYYRIRRTGTPELKLRPAKKVTPRAPRRTRGECQIEGCFKIDDGPHGLCKMHKTRQDRHGDATVVLEPSARNYPMGDRNPMFNPDPGYRAAHQRMRKAKGKARDHQCVDCAAQAAQWSYNHQDPAELHDLSYHNAPYSLDFGFYEPRCVPCHKTFDMAWLGQGAA